MNRTVTRTLTRGLLAAALGTTALIASAGPAAAADSHYEGHWCGGADHTLYEVWSQTEGGETVYWYTAIGSC